MSIYDPGNRPLCAVCHEQLEPATSFFDGEETLCGFLPCSRHPHAGTIYQDTPEYGKLVTGHPSAELLDVTPGQVTGSPPAPFDRVPLDGVQDAPPEAMEALLADMRRAGAEPVTEEEARILRKTLGRISAIIHTKEGVMVHHLKCWPRFFVEILAGRKNFEVRKADRDFQAGDILVLQEFTPHTECRYPDNKTHQAEASPFGCTCGYTNRNIKATIICVVPGGPASGLPDGGGILPGYCILGFYRI